MFQSQTILQSSKQFVESHQYFYESVMGKQISLKLPDNSVDEFVIVKPIKDEEYLPLKDLVASAILIAKFYTNLKPTFAFELKTAACNENLKQFCSLIDVLNDEPKSKTMKSETDMISHLIEQSYIRAIDKPKLLNKYKNFTPEVYGEATTQFADLLFQITKLGKDQIFMDLGSGVGTVALQAAAQTKCKSFGIELRPVPAAYAKALQVDLQLRLHAHLIECGEVTIKQGDFLDDVDCLQMLEKADVIFTNNFVYGPVLNQKLLNLFVCLKHGCQIVSLEAYSAVDMVLSESNWQTPEALFRVERFSYPEGYMSWTNSGGHFFVHTVDRLRLKKFSESIGIKI